MTTETIAAAVAIATQPETDDLLREAGGFTNDASRAGSDPAMLGQIMTKSLPDRGLDRMTATGVESVLCTSALTAHI